MEPTANTPSLDGVPASVIERSRALLAELDARPKDAPISELGRELRAIKQRYIDEGGSFITSDEEFEREVRFRRFGIEA